MLTYPNFNFTLPNVTQSLLGVCWEFIIKQKFTYSFMTYQLDHHPWVHTFTFLYFLHTWALRSETGRRVTQFFNQTLRSASLRPSFTFCDQQLVTFVYLTYFCDRARVTFIYLRPSFTFCDSTCNVRIPDVLLRPSFTFCDSTCNVRILDVFLRLSTCNVYMPATEL